MPYNLVFRVRREYFEAIRNGEKTAEFRAVTEFWEVRCTNANRHLKYKRPVNAIFICGKEKMTKEVSHITMHVDAERALGREPSPQGKKDLGDGPVYAFHLKGGDGK